MTDSGRYTQRKTTSLKRYTMVVDKYAFMQSDNGLIKGEGVYKMEAFGFITSQIPH